MRSDNIMIDLETVATDTRNCAVVQIGACFFDIQKGDIGDAFCMNISPQSEYDLGFEPSEDTLKWWSEQDQKVVESVFSDQVDSESAWRHFSDFLALNPDANIWSHATFDFVIMMNHFKQLGLKGPRFWLARDIRTITDLSGIYKVDYPRNKHHNALDDCVYQSKLVHTCYKRLMY